MKKRIYLIVIITGSILLSSSITNANLDKRKSRLKEKLDEVATYVAVRDSENLEVSEAAISWHIDHIFLVVNQIYKALEQSEESNYKSEFNMIRAYVFTFNTIPRGRATAPEAVRPKANVDLDTIQMHYDQALTTVEKLSNLPAKKHFNHPVFGTLNRDKTIKFLTIHTEHHLKIIRDILKDK
ncbi:MAG: DinB family protein [Bacteroidota bacterium]